MKNQWPELSYKEAKDTYETLHMWTQIVGKIKLTLLPWINHSWHVTLHVTPEGLSTLDMPYTNKNFQVDFDFINHRLKVICSNGKSLDFDLPGHSVASFYRKLFDTLKELQIDVKIRPVPSEVPEPVPFEEDTAHNTYEPTHAASLHQALLKIKDTFTRFRSGFKGKSSPVHFFWGSFDLALSRFSGRKAPRHPGGIPHLPDRITEEAYSHEVSSCGFWPGNAFFPEPAFYCYFYPEPEGFRDAEIAPEEAYFEKSLGEYVLPYSAVQQAKNPDGKLMEFLQSTYEAGARLADWDRSALEA